MVTSKLSRPLSLTLPHKGGGDPPYPDDLQPLRSIVSNPLLTSLERSPPR